MGCSSAIAVEVAMQKKDKDVYCFDGDGAAIMQMGTFTLIGSISPKNFKQILFDNNSYDSTGGQKTNSSSVDFAKVALSCGYKYANTLFGAAELEDEIKKINSIEGPALIVIKTSKGARENLKRPETTPMQNKNFFMDYLR